MGVYDWSPVFISWGREQVELQAGHLGLASCLHFLRWGLGGLRALAFTISLLFAFRNGSNDRNRGSSFVSGGHLKVTVTAGTEKR